jgi:hypothetical protein
LSGGLVTDWAFIPPALGGHVRVFLVDDHFAMYLPTLRPRCQAALLRHERAA